MGVAFCRVEFLSMVLNLMLFVRTTDNNYHNHIYI